MKFHDKAVFITGGTKGPGREMAKAFLAFDDAQYINGETITMDGGMTGYTRETLLDLIGKGRS